MLNVGLKKINKWKTASAEETLDVGKTIAQSLTESSILCLKGDLGAGKTTLIKGIVAEFSGVNPLEVNSPTFTYLNIYDGHRTLYHFDLYRLKGPEDFLARGFDEYFEGPCCIEWAEKIEALLPKNCGVITINYLGEEKREIIYEV